MRHFKELLAPKSSAICEAWLRCAITPYSKEAKGFLLDHGNRFANPVGFGLHSGLQDLWNLLQEQPATADLLESAQSPLNRIIRIRAVQDISPSAACGFVPELLEIVEQQAPGLAQSAPEDFKILARNVRALSLLSFDLYMAAREKIYDLKTRELTRMYHNIIKRADLFCQTEAESDPGKNGSTDALI